MGNILQAKHIIVKQFVIYFTKAGIFLYGKYIEEVSNMFIHLLDSHNILCLSWVYMESLSSKQGRPA